MPGIEHSSTATSRDACVWLRDDGILLARQGPLLLARVESVLSDPTFERYVSALAREIESRSRGERQVVLYDLVAGAMLSAERRRRVARVLQERRPILYETVAAFAMVTTSALARGTLSAVFWALKPPFPFKTFGQLQPACAFLARHLATTDAEELLGVYHAMTQGS